VKRMSEQNNKDQYDQYIVPYHVVVQTFPWLPVSKLACIFYALFPSMLCVLGYSVLPSIHVC
jgi:hypothetical protein